MNEKFVFNSYRCRHTAIKHNNFFFSTLKIINIKNREEGFYNKNLLEVIRIKVAIKNS